MGRHRYVLTDILTAGVEYAFAAGGVDRFRILGIEALAALDPNDAVAFVTGLTFTDDGRFTGTMTPYHGVCSGACQHRSSSLLA